MIPLILNLVVLVSCGTILYLIARSLPRVSESDETSRRGVVERWVTSDLPEKFDEWINNFLVKFLRKLKVFLLRVDNTLSHRLKRISSDTERNNSTGSFDDFST
jgi:hypothetical protein